MLFVIFGLYVECVWLWYCRLFIGVDDGRLVVLVELLECICVSVEWLSILLIDGVLVSVYLVLILEWVVVVEVVWMLGLLVFMGVWVEELFVN